MEHDGTWSLCGLRNECSTGNGSLESQKHSQQPSSRSSMYSSIHPIPSHPTSFQIIPDHSRSFQIIPDPSSFYRGPAYNATLTSQTMTPLPPGQISPAWQGASSHSTVSTVLQRVSTIFKRIYDNYGFVWSCPKKYCHLGAYFRHAHFQVDVLLPVGAIYVCFLSPWCRMRYEVFLAGNRLSRGMDIYFRRNKDE